jgi:hypothetical protein
MEAENNIFVSGITAGHDFTKLCPRPNFSAIAIDVW